MKYHRLCFITKLTGGEKNTVEEYDVEKNIWVSLPPMNVNRLNGLLLEFPENGILENWA